LLSAALLFGAGAAAQPSEAQPDEDAPRYVVLAQNAAIPFALRTIIGYRVGEDDSLILRHVSRRWYRAELDRPCARDLPWRHRIALRPNPGGTFDRFSYVIIDGRRCYLYSLDEIADPRPPRAGEKEAEG
jgi:hypothetical protein